MKNVLKLLAEGVLIQSGLTRTASAAVIQKKIFELGLTSLLISNKEMDDIMLIVKSLQESDILIKRVSRTTKNEKKKNIKKNLLACY